MSVALGSVPPLNHLRADDFALWRVDNFRKYEYESAVRDADGMRREIDLHGFGA
ncbi:hypothetical protein BH09MYX1_BH09MYX1_62730 [soil metagenome]